MVPAPAHPVGKGKAIGDAGNSDSIASAVAAAAPFRMRRSAATAGYDPRRAGEPAAPPADAVPKPSLVLAGIVWGARPSAVIGGIPGSARARVVERGDTMAGLKVRRVERERVVITGYDTTWNLRVRGLE
jgi:type II secretory pathway component PulC